MMKIPFVASTIMLILVCFLSATLFSVLGLPFNEYVRQTLSQIGVWLVPSLCFAAVCYDSFWRDLKLTKNGSKFDYLSFILLFIVSMPLISYLQYVNENMSFPQSMASIEQIFRQMEEKAQNSILRLISGTTPLDLVRALFISAVLPAICEEFFFRGIVLNNLFRRTSKIHLSVWLSAFLFSFIHLQFYGFMPRFVLGLLLGYAFIWSKSLWLPIVLHFLNNALATLMYYFYQNNWISENPLTQNTQTATLSMAVLSFLLSVGLLWFIFYNKARSNFSKTAQSVPPQSVW